MTVSSEYAVLSAMLAPAFFLTATASLLISANNRLARIIDRARALLQQVSTLDEGESLRFCQRQLGLQRRRSLHVMRAGQLLYAAISFFVGTSLAVALDTLLDHRLAQLPTWLAASGVLAMLAASLLLARESTLAVTAINEEMDQHQPTKDDAPSLPS
ncbi:MAG: DUF2721 domain-containing protein [Xanthomonadaceae bacterium]|nr:DUF2721 domain-containing protein [Xanthomonadaceae bacterium]